MTTLTPDETILGLLAAETRHGYQLIACFRDPAQLGRIWHLSTSQIYAVLKRLETQGMIAGQWVETPDAPPRTEYSLTEAGRVALAVWLDELQPSASVRAVRVEFLSRLYLARLLNLPTTDIVRRQRAACLLQRRALQTQLESEAPGVGRLTLELVIAQNETILQWINRCELIERDADDA